MSEVSVLVTGVGGAALGSQILKALRAADTDYRIVATDLSAMSTGFALSDAREIVPRADSDEYIPRLLDLCRRHAIRALFPGSEPELHAIARSRRPFEELGIMVPVQPAELLETCDNKAEARARLSSEGFHCPRATEAREAQELASWDCFPCVIKPLSHSSGSAHVYIAQDHAELAALATMALASCPTVSVEEYVGRFDAEYTVGVLSDLNGELIHSIAMHRDILRGLSNRLRVPNRSGRRELGEVLAISSGVSQGHLGHYPEVTGPCEAVAKSLGSRGPLNIQCRLSGARVVIFEINPRFSGTTSARALVGFNEPDLLVRRHVLNETVEARFDYREGTVLRSLHETLFEDAE